MIPSQDPTDLVTLYSGAPGLTLPLFARPGRNDLNLDLTLFYAGRNNEMAQTWNLDIPTGVLGMGWAVPFPMITKGRQYTASSGDEELYLVGGDTASQLVPTATDHATGSIIYQAMNYQFWQIRYDPARERWTIIRENGDTYIYGDNTISNDGVQWAVAWDNWIGASVVTSGQEQVAAAWNLVRITNRWDDRVDYFYDNVLQHVQPHDAAADANQTYTQASYLSSIVGVTGETIRFSFAEKNADEYQERHTNPAAPNAWQDVYGTRYLASVTLASPSGSTLESISFGYDMLGTEDVTKRVLTSISRQTPTGDSLPSTKFSYYGMDVADGVSATHLYNGATQALYGSLKTMTQPQGAVTTYRYADLDLSLCSRQVTVEKPTRDGVSFSLPRLAFSDAFTVVLWFGDDQSLNVTAYTWEGRWLLWSEDHFTVADSTAYQQADLVTSEDFFTIRHGQQIHLYHVDPNRVGQWVMPAAGNADTATFFTTDFTDGEAVSLAAGDRFLAAVGQSSGKLYRYRWDGIAWVAADLVQLPAGTTPARFNATAKFNVLTTSGTSVSQTEDPIHVSLFILDALGAWQTFSFEEARIATKLTDLDLYAGIGFTLQRLTYQSGGDATADYRVFQWNLDATQLVATTLETTRFSGQAVDPAIRGSAVFVDQKAYRYDGATWQSVNLADIGAAVGQTVTHASYGWDKVARIIATGSGFAYDLVTYDPNTALWSVPANMSQSGSSDHVGCQVARTGQQSSPFVVLDNDVRFQQPDATWTNGFALPNPPSGSDLASLQLLQARFVVYQNGNDSFIYTLLNGTIANPSDPIVLSDQRMLVDGQPGTYLVGLDAFMTYTGTFGDADATMNLYRVVNEKALGNCTGYVVSSLTVNSGYLDVITGYQFDAATATIDARGFDTRFNKTVAVPGNDSETYGYSDTYFFNGLSASEPPASPYPIGPGANASEYDTRIRGLAYSQQVFDNSNSRKSGTTRLWQVYPEKLGQNAQATWVRMVVEYPSLDLANGQVSYQFASETGLVQEIRTHNFNSQGEQELLIQAFRYWWQEYDLSKHLNLLTPIVEVILSTEYPDRNTTEITGKTATTWKQDWGHGSGQWAPYQTFQSLNAAAEFTWWLTGSPPTSDWRLAANIVSRTEAGLVASTEAGGGLVSATLYDRGDFLPIARFANGTILGQEANYYGFEPYETENGWGWTNPDQTLQEHITTAQFHTGSQSLELPQQPSAQSGPFNVFQPQHQDQAYVFSAWVKTESGFSPDKGLAKWVLTVYRADNNQMAGGPFDLVIENTANQWVYLQQILDLPVIRSAGSIPDSVALYIFIQAYNQNSEADVYLDNLRFSPVAGLFSANVYDAAYLRITATLGNNGETMRAVYDSHGRFISQIGPRENVLWLTGPSYSRDLTSDDHFLPDFPNTSLQLQTTSTSAFYDFHDGNTDHWTFAGGNWAITGGELTFAPTNPPASAPLGGTATLSVFAFTNFAVRVVCKTQSTSNAGVGNGEIFVYWDGSAQQWVLARKQDNGSLVSEAVSTAQGFGENWILAIVEGVAMFYLNGIQIFSYTYEANLNLQDVGKPVLTALQASRFDDLLVLNDPQLSLSFVDGEGNFLQSVAYMGITDAGGQAAYPSNSFGVLQDALGRPAFTRNALDAPLQLAAPPNSQALAAELIEGDLDTYLVDPEGNDLSVSQYLAGQGGIFDYTTQTYETSPLTRVIETILPREVSADVTKYTTTYAYLTNTGIGEGAVMNDLLPTAAENRYFLLKINDPQGVDHYLLRDQANREVARRTRLEDGTFHTTFIEYDAAGNVTTVNQPNYYDPPHGSAATDWQETQTYDFLGQLASRTMPDTRTTHFAYDASGQKRFEMTAAGAAQTPQLIRYLKHDVLGRLVESGYLQDANYPWGSPQLEAKLNEASFPNTEDPQSAQYASGRWYRKNEFDRDPDHADAANLLGRLFRSRINNATPGVETQTFAYDVDGNMTAQTSQIETFDAAPYVTSYGYNNLSGLSEIIYPRLASATEVRVGYYFNRLGQIASVGDVLTGSEVVDPSNPATAGEAYYAAYTYNELGTMASESLNNGRGNPPGVPNPQQFSRTFGYTPQGWLTRIDSDYFSQDLDYYQTSAQKYYNGNIAATRFTYKPDKWTCPPKDFGYDFRYNNLNQLTQARNDLNDAWNLNLGPGDEQAYDANGNLQMVQRGATSTTYSYAASGEVQTNDEVHHLESTATSRFTFDDATSSPPCSAAWCWGSSNGGPSDSAVVDDDERGKVLRLAGGFLGHYEFLRLQTYLDPRSSYQLSFQVKTDAAFEAGSGEAAWMLRFFSQTTEVLTATLMAIPATAGAWESQTVALDIPSLRANLGLGEDIAYVQVECVNYLKEHFGRSAGPSIYLDDPSVTIDATVVTDAFAYDQDGNLTVAPTKGLTVLAYDAVTGLPQSVSLADGSSLHYSYNDADFRSLSLHRNAAGDDVSSVRTFRDPNGRPLLSIDSQTGRTSRFVYGPNGLIAREREDGTDYILSDNQGSTRVLVDGETGGVSNHQDYLPFGGSMRRGADSSLAQRYTGQDFDEKTGLYNYHARLYDPELRRFYAADPANQDAGPYNFVGNNPVNRVDPDGEFWVPLIGMAAIAGYQFYYNSESLPLGSNLALVTTGLVSTLATSALARSLVLSDPIVGQTRRGAAGQLLKGSLMVGTLNAVGSGMVNGLNNVLHGWEAGIFEETDEGGALAAVSGEFASGFLTQLPRGFATGAGSYVVGSLIQHGLDLHRFNQRGVHYYSNQWNRLKGNIPGKNAFLSDISAVEMDWIKRRSVIYKKIKAFLRRPGGLHEWLEVAQFGRIRNWGLTTEQVASMRTPTATNPMFIYNGVPWAHAYNAAHQYNTYLITTSSGPLEYQLRLWWSGLVAPGAQPGGPMFTWSQMLWYPFQ